MYHKALMPIWDCRIDARRKAPHSTEWPSHRISATTIRISNSIMSKNTKNILLPWIISLSLCKFWSRFQTRLPRNLFFVFIKTKVYKCCIGHWWPPCYTKQTFRHVYLAFVFKLIDETLSNARIFNILLIRKIGSTKRNYFILFLRNYISGGGLRPPPKSI